MGCGESKHAVATTEPIKSTSRSSSRRIENPEQNTTTTTTTITTTASSVSETRNGCSEAIDGNKKDGEKTVGVIPGEPFVYQKPPMEATKRGAVVNEGKKKLVVAVAHDRTASKESQVSDYFSEDGIEEKSSEYESPQPDEERGSNLAVVALQGYKKIQSGRHGKQGKTEEEMKQEQIEQFKTEEGVSQRQDDQVVVAKQDVQETKITQVEHGTTMAAEDKGEQDRSNDTIVVTTTAKQETKMMEIDDVKPTELVVRTIAEGKIKDTDA